MKKIRLRTFTAHAAAAIGLAGLGTSSPAHTQTIDPVVAPVEITDELLRDVKGEAALAAPAEVDAVIEEEVAELIGEGEASYYGHELAGNRTASGEIFRPSALTAAHRTLPLGSKLRVTNVRNGKSVVVRVNDRGPFVKKRIIDVSLGAAQKIQMVSAGRANVRLELLR